MTTNEQLTQILHQAQHHQIDPFISLIFAGTLLLPGSPDWKLGLYHFYSPIILAMHIPPLVEGIIVAFGPEIILVLFLVSGFLLYKVLQLFVPLIARLLGRKPQPYIFLELTFPSDTSKSAFATEQLYKLLHTLGRQVSLIERLSQHKKIYSLELVATKNDGIRYIICVPVKEEGIFKRSILAYLPGSKIQVIDDYLDHTVSSTTYIGLSELKLSNDHSLSLNNQKILDEHDPIAYLTGNMTKLNDRELIALQIITTPVVSSAHRKLVKKFNTLRSNIYRGKPLTPFLNESTFNILTSLPVISQLWFFIKIWVLVTIGIIKYVLDAIVIITSDGKNTALFMSQPVTPQAILNPYEQELRTVVKEKIDQHLYESSIRLLVAGIDEEHLHGRMPGLLAAFGPMSSPYQSLITKGSLWPSSILIKQRFNQFSKRTLSPNKAFNQNPILSTSEISDLYHFPYTDTTRTEDLVKILSPELPAPLSLKQEKELDVIFGKNTYGSAEIPIGLTDDERSRHCFIEGQTGSGKSTVMFHMAKDDMQKGRGICVVDPHGDLIEDLLAIIPEKRIDDVVYINPFDIKFPIRINLLELTESADEDEQELEKELVCESVISIFRRVFSDDEKTNAHRIERILRNTIYTAFYVKDSTIFTVNKILTNEAFRREVLTTVDNEDLLDFWKGEFGKAGEWQVFKMIDGVTAKVERFLFSPIAKRILEKSHSTISFDQLLDAGKIILCNLSEGKLGEDTSKLLGTTIITKIHLAMLRRSRMEKSLRKPFYLFIDEFQNFATKSFTKLLSGGRKFGLRVTIAEQSTTQQDDFRITNTILANVGTVMCFKTASPIDEEIMLSQFAPLVKKGDLVNLPRFHFYIKLGALEPQEPFTGETFPIEVHKDPEKLQAIIDASRKNYASVYEKPEKKKAPVKSTKKGISKKDLGTLSDE